MSFRSIIDGLKIFLGVNEESSNDIAKLIKRLDTIWMRLALAFLGIIVTYLLFFLFYQTSIKDFALNFCTNILVLFITLIFVDWILAYQRQRKRSSIRLAMEKDLADLRNIYFGVVFLLFALARRYKVGPDLQSMLDRMGFKGTDLSRFADIVDDLEKCWLPIIEELKEKGYSLDEKFLKLLKEQADKLKETVENKINLFGQFYEDYILSWLLTTYSISQALATSIQQYQTFKEFTQFDAKSSKDNTSSNRQYQKAIENRCKELASDIYSNLAINLLGLIIYWAYLEQLPHDESFHKLMEYWKQYS